VPITSSLSSASLIELELVRDTQTRGHRALASTALAQRRAGNNNNSTHFIDILHMLNVAVGREDEESPMMRVKVHKGRLMPKTDGKN